MLDLHTTQHGYEEVYPPYMVLEKTLVGTGNLPKFGDALFKDREAGMWLIPTAEVPVTNMYRDEILPAEQLPKGFEYPQHGIAVGIDETNLEPVFVDFFKGADLLIGVGFDPVESDKVWHQTMKLVSIAPVSIAETSTFVSG